MPDKIRVNTANPRELLEIPGLDAQQAEQIVRFRAAHGPITDAAELAKVLGAEKLDDTLCRHVDFSPALDTAPEAPGA